MSLCKINLFLESLSGPASEFWAVKMHDPTQLYSKL